MIFNDVSFLAFFVLVLGFFHLAPGPAAKKLVIIAAGLLFFASWDPAFLPVLLVYAAGGWGAGLLVARLEEGRARALVTGVSVGLLVGLLAWFKYRGFVATQLHAFGLDVGAPARIAAPIGISFFTFEIISYLVDVRTRHCAPIRPPLDFACFLMFFPRMVSGPIVRPADFARQLDRGEWVRGGNLLRAAELFVFGATLKGVMADAQAPIVDHIFAAPMLYSRVSVALGATAYAVQIFGDFFGYSLMASGLAVAMGFVLPRNFMAPYASASITEFWRRWHMTLSRWLRDYLYIPLGGNRVGPLRARANLVVTMLLGGLWHGPGWNFVLWGGAHGLLLVAERPFRPIAALIPAIPRRALGTLYTLGAVWLLWIPFRAPSFATTREIFSVLLAGGGPNVWYPPATLIAVAALVPWHVAHECSPRFRALFDSENPASLIEPVRAVALGAVIMFCIAFTQQGASGFIYFQF